MAPPAAPSSLRGSDICGWGTDLVLDQQIEDAFADKGLAFQRPMAADPAVGIGGRAIERHEWNSARRQIAGEIVVAAFNPDKEFRAVAFDECTDPADQFLGRIGHEQDGMRKLQVGRDCEPRVARNSARGRLP